MRVRWPLLATLLTIGASYVAYPYVALYRLGSAIKGADTTTLEALVDWPAVREGIKEDICDLADDAPGLKTGGGLPAFGASFMRGVASNAVDQAVTPQALLAAASTLPTSHPSPRGADVHVNWAFFDSPTTFIVSLQPDGPSDPVKLEMDLENGQWRVQRVWLPAEMLKPRSRT